MSKCYAYIRVSTPKQGEKGVSLQEQREAIKQYAQRNGLEIIEWLEEQQTAAKRGRPVFGRMLSCLQDRKAAGVIIHKIDRGARNLKDWAELGELIDKGVDVHFANEGLDLGSRGGRLSADIQAVVAADYIRNLREETRKGFYGRLRQGIYPLPAPIGYLDQGRGTPKSVDPVKGPLVRKAFELYATGRFSLESLLAEITRLGLKNRRERPLSLTGLSTILNNPFYIGLIRLKRTGETYPGLHEPLIPKSLFDRVQDRLAGKARNSGLRHFYLFRQLLLCKHCGYAMIGEQQKGHVYYRCHTRDCATTGVREEAVEEALLRNLRRLQLSARERQYLKKLILKYREHWETDREDQIQALELGLTQLRDRLNRLTDAYLDGAIEKPLFEERKEALLKGRMEVQDRLKRLRSGEDSIPDQLTDFLELAGNAYQSYRMGLADEKRDLIRAIASNRYVDRKKPVFELVQPFQIVAERYETPYSPPYRGVPRTLDQLWHRLLHCFKSKEAPAGPGGSPVDGIRRAA